MLGSFAVGVLIFVIMVLAGTFLMAYGNSDEWMWLCVLISVVESALFTLMAVYILSLKGWL